jgi:hypothetical protein
MVRAWIVERLGEQGFEQLANGLSGSELHSVLLEVMHARAHARGAADVFHQYLRDDVCKPAAVDPRTALAIDAALFEAAAGFEGIELAPVAPLGACSTLAPTAQNRVLSALRSTEIVADPTNVLALECGRRLRDPGSLPVHLATSHRVVRMQPYPRLPGYAPHFRLFVLASAGRETEDHAFTVDSMVRQVRSMLDALDLLQQRGYRFGERRLEVLAGEERAELGDRIARCLPGPVERGVLSHAYYSRGLRYRLWVTAADGSQAPIADGGAFDWLATLLSNRRAVFIASGFGSQLAAHVFRAEQAPPSSP